MNINSFQILDRSITGPKVDCDGLGCAATLAGAIAACIVDVFDPPAIVACVAAGMVTSCR